ncbi:HEAT repeat domain-containing protein [Patescibacteria group bacterium]|nr:HEAT repeat domain-containing protein [Patescibacteria group bacterium]
MKKHISIFQKVSIKKTVLTILGIGFFLFIASYIITSIWIGNSVKENCMLAQGKYGGDLPAQAGCVEALSKHLEDETAPFGERNSAIWSLGQLGDPKALPVLEKYYTGNIPDREPWNGIISQYELKKTINLASGGLNITHFLWRNSLP